MKNIFKRVLSLVLCLLMIIPAVACNKDNGGGGGGGSSYDAETRSLRLAIGALDGKFNPFFATTLNDSEIAGMTQVNMLNLNDKGEIVYGDDWPTVTQDLKTTYYDSKIGGSVIANGSKEGRTEYEFVIKNGMKFSDGQPLTIKDVLFNLYVYLDPMYMGSNTMYSTDIQGLMAYRTQDPNYNEDSSSNTDSQFYLEAQNRISALIKYSADNEPLDSQGEKDLATVKEIFREEVTADWNSIQTSWVETYQETHNFTSAWQAYLYAEGVVVNQRRLNPTTNAEEEVKGSDGKYLTTLDPNVDGVKTGGSAGEVRDEQLIAEIAEATSATKVSAYMSANNVSEEIAITNLTRDCVIDMVYSNYMDDRSQLQYIVSYWATASTALETFAADARSSYYANIPDNERVKSISGISYYSLNAGETFNGKTLTEKHDVLKIVINGIDPKAVYNFAFSVAPMHYYGGSWAVNNYNGTTCFGVKSNDLDFFEDVLQDPNKNGLPVGAGAYKATSYDGSTVTKNNFNANNMVYYTRNDYFYTMGKNIQNAKIKNLTYKVMGDDKIITALAANEIDYGQPNGTPANKAMVQGEDHLNLISYPTGGYGYVGINPKFVPEWQVRKAIMISMDTSIIKRNYYQDLCSLIYRPMSTTSWAYPDGLGEQDALYTTDDQEILDLCAAAGYNKGSDGKLRNADGRTLKFTFTIAGETKNHPAYDMFIDAQGRLNKLGFDITVSTDIQALKKLNTGNLEVWAAAWSSGVDPDMYQIYHKDSKAASTNNWYKNGIVNDTNNIYTYEQPLVDLLAQKIDAARETMSNPERKALYKECLDIVMDLCVELPTYQRNDFCVYNKNVIKASSLVQNTSHYMGPLGKIWEVEYN